MKRLRPDTPVVGRSSARSFDKVVTGRIWRKAAVPLKAETRSAVLGPQHVKHKIEAARSWIYAEILKKIKRPAPIGMLLTAFIGGMLFARRR
jgi:hypothetical protein